MQRSNKTIGRNSTSKARARKRYTAAQLEEFKQIRKATAELNAVIQARADQREWEAFLAWQARNSSAIVLTPAAPPPVLVGNLPHIPALIPLPGQAVPAPKLQALLTPEELAARIELARGYRERCEVAA